MKTPVPIPACPASLEETCTNMGETVEFWCRAGGFLFDCEVSGTDNDGDGTFAEHHFLKKRSLVKYHCTTRDYTVCGDWSDVKIGAGSAQDKCCADWEPEPACPADSCKKQ